MPLLPTKTLPEDYKPVFQMDLSKNKGLAIGLNVTALALFLVFGVWFARISMRLRPELWQEGRAVSLGTSEVLSLVLALVLMTVLHEGVHGLFFWWFTKEKPKFGIKLLYAYAAAPDWYLPRNLFLIVGSAPLVLLSAIGIALMPVFPLGWMPGLIFFLTFNAAGAVGDILTVIVVLNQPKEALVNDLGDNFTVYGVETPISY
jgi:hypothetical protein